MWLWCWVFLKWVNLWTPDILKGFCCSLCNRDRLSPIWRSNIASREGGETQIEGRWRMKSVAQKRRWRGKAMTNVGVRIFWWGESIAWLEGSTKSKSCYDQQSVGQSVLVSGTRDQFFPFSIFFDSFGFVDVWRPLWREVGSVLFSFCRASLA
jgi:hypothetical protein